MAPSRDKVSHQPSQKSSDPDSFTFSGSQKRSSQKKSSHSSSLRPSNRSQSHQIKSNKRSQKGSVHVMSLRSRSNKGSRPSSDKATNHKNSNDSSSQPYQQVQHQISGNKPQLQKEEPKMPDQTLHDHRVGASSSVNFIYLDDHQQLQRYQNKMKEYHALKDQLKQLEKQNKLQDLRERKRSYFKITKERQAFKTARKKLHGHPFEIDDAQQLIENLAGLLASKKMEPISIEFMLLAAIVRRVKEKITFGQKVELTKLESRFLKKASKEKLIEFFSGVRVKADRELRYAILGENMSAHDSGVSGSVNSLSIPIANAEVGLNASMLRQFNKDHPLKSIWHRD